VPTADTARRTGHSGTRPDGPTHTPPRAAAASPRAAQARGGSPRTWAAVDRAWPPPAENSRPSSGVLSSSSDSGHATPLRCRPPCCRLLAIGKLPTRRRTSPVPGSRRVERFSASVTDKPQNARTRSDGRSPPVAGLSMGLHLHFALVRETFRPDRSSLKVGTSSPSWVGGSLLAAIATSGRARLEPRLGTFEAVLHRQLVLQRLPGLLQPP
jgi:hypothetical protein